MLIFSNINFKLFFNKIIENSQKNNKLLRWVAASALTVMLVLNIMVSLEFERDKILPSITLIELGNVAMAQDVVIIGGDNTGPADYVTCVNGGTKKYCASINSNPCTDSTDCN